MSEQAREVEPRARGEAGVGGEVADAAGVGTPVPSEAPDAPGTPGKDVAGKGTEGSGVHVARSPVRCPFCHDAVDLDAEGPRAVVCQACLSRHHAPCWAEGARCASCGGTAALEAAPVRAEPGSCRLCGVHRSAVRFSCPTCTSDVCDGCYRARFRRCVSCATDLMRDEKRLAQLRKRKDSAQAGQVLSIAGAVLLAMGSVLAASAAGAPWGLVGLAVALVVALGLVGLGVRVGRRARELEREADELEVALAPFEQGFTDKIDEGLRWLKRKVGI